MRISASLWGRAILLIAAAFGGYQAKAQISVLNNRYDNSQTGANTSETILSPSNVNTTLFGKLYSYPVDGNVYAQPLYVPGLNMGSLGTHNVVYIVTMNDKVYAFDADSSSPSPLWTRNLLTSGASPVPITDIVGRSDLNIMGNVGIEGTPVIDPATQTMYLVAVTKENGAYIQRLHALDITTGNEKFGGPVTIQPSVAGSGYDAVGGQIAFNPKMQNQRAALALSNGNLLIAWGSHEDFDPYHGWVMAFNAATLGLVGAFCDTPNSRRGGTWMAGRAPVIDSSGNAYFVTGNGTYDGETEFGDSALRFSVSPSSLTLTGSLSLADWFAPADYDYLDENDLDFGSNGAIRIPNSNVIVAGGKESILFVLNMNNLGKEVTGNTQVLQTIDLNGGAIRSGPAYWNGFLCIWADDDHAKVFQFNSSTSTFNSSPTVMSSTASEGPPGGALTISANGTNTNSGVLWSAMYTGTGSSEGQHPGILRALNAQSLTELWNSEDVATRDRLGTLSKFEPPLVVNGRVYLATQDNSIAVYGLLPTSSDFLVTALSRNQVAIPAGQASYTVEVSSLNGFGGTVSLGVSGLPSGITASFSPASVAGGAGQSTLLLTTTAEISPGTYFFTITGASGSLSHSASASLVIDSPESQGFNIDFVGGGTPMEPSEIAGVVPGAVWNNAEGPSISSPLVLVNGSGITNTATVTWTADNVWTLPISDTPGDFRMMRGYLDTGSEHTTTISVSGLASLPYGYNVYLYTDGDNGYNTRSGIYSISGPGTTTNTVTVTDASQANFNGTYIPVSGSSGAGNYVMFTVLGTSFTLTATPSTASDGIERAPVNGLQIIPSTGPPAEAPARAVSIDFVGNDVPMGPAESAGVIAKANWNNATNDSSAAPFSLVDETGTVDGATVTWKSDNTWSTTIADAPGNARMMKGYLDTGAGNPTTVNVSSLPVSSTGYDIYVYSDGDNGFNTRAGTYTISGPGITTSSTSVTDAPGSNFSGTFIQANGSVGNFVKFTIDATAFTLTATPGPASDGVMRAPLNGIQIIPSTQVQGPTVISINFVGNDVPMGTAETAGAVPETHWNNGTGNVNASPLALFDENGNSTVATVAWTSDNTWATPITDAPGNARMMKGYLDTGDGNPTTISVSGLAASPNGYNVYVYTDGDNSFNTRSGIYSISGPGITTTTISATDAANTNFSGTFVQANNSAGNYVEFTIQATAFTITATPGPSSDGVPRAPVNGIQIVSK